VKTVVAVDAVREFGVAVVVSSGEPR